MEKCSLPNWAILRPAFLLAAMGSLLASGCQKAQGPDAEIPVVATMTGEVVHLSPDARELGARFAEGEKKARLLMILSPT